MSQSLTFDVKVVPSSGKCQCALDRSGRLKCYLKSPPEKGKANAELIKLMAKAAKVPQKAVAIVAGQTSRNKKIKVETDMTYQDLLAALGVQVQQTIW